MKYLLVIILTTPALCASAQNKKAEQHYIDSTYLSNMKANRIDSPFIPAIGRSGTIRVDTVDGKAIYKTETPNDIPKHKNGKAIRKEL